MEEISREKYTEGLLQHKKIEKEKWLETVKKSCFARTDNEWIKDTCGVTDEHCNYEFCFALQIIKLSKGFL